jgi:hypothetical protein
MCDERLFSMQTRRSLGPKRPIVGEDAQVGAMRRKDIPSVAVVRMHTVEFNLADAMK